MDTAQKLKMLHDNVEELDKNKAAQQRLKTEASQLQKQITDLTQSFAGSDHLKNLPVDVQFKLV